MKLFNLICLILMINILILSVHLPQTNALSKRKLLQMKKLGALALLMKMKSKKKMLAIPIPIPIPIGLLKELKKSKSKDSWEHQIKPKLPPIASWPTIRPEIVQNIPLIVQPPFYQHQLHSLQPIQKFEIKEPIIAIPEIVQTNPITIPVHRPTNRLVLAGDLETETIDTQPIIEIEQTTEPINEQSNDQILIKNNRRARFQNANYK